MSPRFRKKTLIADAGHRLRFVRSDGDRVRRRPPRPRRPRPRSCCPTRRHRLATDELLRVLRHVQLVGSSRATSRCLPAPPASVRRSARGFHGRPAARWDCVTVVARRFVDVTLAFSPPRRTWSTSTSPFRECPTASTAVGAALDRRLAVDARNRATGTRSARGAEAALSPAPRPRTEQPLEVESPRPACATRSSLAVAADAVPHSLMGGGRRADPPGATAGRAVPGAGPALPSAPSAARCGRLR